MLKQSNTTWSDCVVVTNMAHRLVEAMMKYQMYTWPVETQGNCFGGDRSVLMEARVLRDRLNRLLENES